MGTPPNEEVVAKEQELAEVKQKLRNISSRRPGASSVPPPPEQEELERRRRAIEDQLVELGRENDRALGGDLVDEDLGDVAAPSEPGR